MVEPDLVIIDVEADRPPQYTAGTMPLEPVNVPVGLAIQGT